jgi:hypothetical protein
MKKLTLLASLLFSLSNLYAAPYENIGALQVLRPGQAYNDVQGEVLCPLQNVKIYGCNCANSYGRNFSYVIFKLDDTKLTMREKGLELCKDRAENDTQEMLMRANSCHQIY